MTPYLAFWVPEHLGGSGVLATVACGLYVSWNGPRLIPSATRLQGIFFWDLIVYLIEGFVFLVTGLQARTLIEKAHDFPARANCCSRPRVTDGDRHRRALRLGVSGDLSAALAHPVAAPSAIRRRRGRQPFFLAFTGVRGVVSLAAALAIPYTHRQRRAVPAPRPDPVRHLRRHHHHAGRPGPDAAGGDRAGSASTSIGKTEHRRRDQRPNSPRARRRSSDVDEAAREARSTSTQSPDDVDRAFCARATTAACRSCRTISTTASTHMRRTPTIKQELIEAERDFIYELLRDGKITDESRRRIEYELDLEEASVANRAQDGGGWF